MCKTMCCTICCVHMQISSLFSVVARLKKKINKIKKKTDCEAHFRSLSTSSEANANANVLEAWRRTRAEKLVILHITADSMLLNSSSKIDLKEDKL